MNDAQPTLRVFDGRDVEQLRRAWSAPAVEAWAEIGSTSDRAAQLARDGAARGTVVLADAQTAGRGRQGAPWISGPECGLWMSIVLDPSDACPQLPLIVGVAAAEGIESVVPEAHVRVKWPNDLLIDDRKLGGILTERSAGRVVVGIGVNVRPPPDTGGLDWPATAIALDSITGEPLSRSALAGAVIQRLFDYLSSASPSRRALAALASRDALAGRRIDTDEHGPGTARGIHPDGSLALERPDGTGVRVRAGSVRRL